MKTIKKGTYRHYKGKQYRVLGTALHSETHEELVVYECLYTSSLSQLWVRPKKMFSEYVTANGKKVKRFTYITYKKQLKEQSKYNP